MSTPPKPPRKKASDLAHPKASTVKGWNGDLRRARTSNRFGNAPDLEDRGFASRRAEQGLTVTDGSAVHETRVWNTQAKDTVNLQGTIVHERCGAIQPRPDAHTFDPSFVPAKELPYDNAPSVRSVVRSKGRVTTNDS